MKGIRTTLLGGLVVASSVLAVLPANAQRANTDLIVLKKAAGGTALIPFVSQMVPTVDLAGGRVIVDLPEGLLDL